MARFVLVHGAWHGAWCFRYLVEELEDRGHDAVAVDLPCEEIGLDQRDYAHVVGAQPDAIVVGHSLGGQTIPHVAARLHVYLAGLLPVADAYDDCFADGFGGFVRDELGRSYWPDADTCADKMYPDCTRPQSDWAYAQLRRQAPFPAASGRFGRGDVVIATTRDASIDPDWQMRVGKSSGARVLTLDAGHSPFFTQPDELADLLDALA